MLRCRSLQVAVIFSLVFNTSLPATVTGLSRPLPFDIGMGDESHIALKSSGPATMRGSHADSAQIVSTAEAGEPAPPEGGAAAATPGSGATSRISITADGRQGDGPSGVARISADGRYVVFSSQARNLVSGDTNNVYDIFVRDREAGQTTRVSVTSGGGQGDGPSFVASISADGRFVAFRSTAKNLVVGDTNNQDDVFLHDRGTQETIRISVGPGGVQGNGPSIKPVISADGKYVAFESWATNLVNDDHNGREDVFLYDRQARRVTRVSVVPGGAEANDESDLPAISADGRYVAFASQASNFVPGDDNNVCDTNNDGIFTDNCPDVFVYDRDTGQIERVSVGSGGTQALGWSAASSVSADGRYVAFESKAPNLVIGDNNGVYDIFVRDRQASQTWRVSVDSSGGEGNSESVSPSISADGRYVAFVSRADNLVVGDTNGTADVFVHDRETRRTIRVSVTTDGRQGLDSSASDNPALSADGRYVAFASLASNLVDGDTNGQSDVFVRDRGDGSGNTITIPLVSGSDDAGVEMDCIYRPDWKEVYLGRCNDGSPIVSGFRFQDVPIAAGAAISEAYLELTVDSTYPDDIASQIFGQASANSAPFSDVDRPSDRPLTTNFVNWNIPASDVWSAGQSRRSPDLAPVIQEIVNLPGWASGNSLTMILRANPAVAGNAHRRVFAWEREQNSAHTARLIVIYRDAVMPTPTPPGPTSTASPTSTPTVTPSGPTATSRPPSPTSTPRPPTSTSTPGPTQPPPTPRPDRPLVKTVTPCIVGPFYFKPWPFSVSNRYEARIDWRGLLPAYVDFILNGVTARESTSGDTASHNYDLGRDLRFSLLGARNTLEVRAVADNGTPSSSEVLHPIGIETPPWLPFTEMKLEIPVGCSGRLPMKAKWKILYPNPALTAVVLPPSWFPFIGGLTFGIRHTQAGVELEFAGDGQGSGKVYGQTGFNVGNNEITGKVFGKGEGIIREGEPIRLQRASFGLDLEGTIKKQWPLVDVICKAFTGGLCPLREAERIPVVGSVIRWFNERAIFEAKIQPAIELAFNFRSDQSSLRWESGTGTGKVKLTLSLILNIIRNGLTAEGYGGGEPSITLQVPKNPSYLKKLALKLFAGVKVKVWRWERKFESFYEWSYSPTGAAIAFSPVDARTWSAATDWSPMPRDYAADPTAYAVFRANERPLRLGTSPATLQSDTGLLATDDNVIATNVFPDGHPALAADGSLLLLWVHDDTGKPLMQGEEIVYSVYDGATWSTPASITNDALQDFAPQVSLDGTGKVVAVWERNKTVQSEATQLNAAYANAFEIAYSIWNGNTWSAPAYLTNNAVLDHAPVLVRGNDGVLLLVWQQNAAGELLGTIAQPDTLYYSLWNGTAWSTPQVLLNNVDGTVGLTAARYDANAMAVSYSRDTDGDLTSDEDQELYQLTWNGSVWSGPIRLINDVRPDNQPTLFYDDGGSPRLLWLKGDTLYALLGSLAGTPRAVAVEGSAAILDYAAAQDDAGNLVLLWQGYSEEGVDVFYAVYDQANNVFSLIEQLTHDEPLEKFMAPAFAPSGELVMAYNKTALVTDTMTVSPTLVISNVTAFRQTDLYVLRHTFGPDLALEATDLVVSPANPALDSMARISATLHNAGDRAVVNPKVAFYVGDPTLGGVPVGTATAALTLTGGISTTLSVDWTVPASGGPFDIYVVADPDRAVTELNETNNTAHFFVAVPDLTVDGMRVAYGTGQMITLTATLSNTGVVAAAPITVAFRLDDPITGTVVAIGNSASLAAGAKTDIQAIWDAANTPTGRYNIYAIADPDNMVIEADKANNEEWTGVGILPDLVLRSTAVVTGTNTDGSLSVSIWVFNEGLREADGVVLVLYDRLPEPGATPLISVTLAIPAGQYRVATLNMGHYPWPGFYAGVGINGEADDRDLSNNVLFVGKPPTRIYLPIIFRNH